MGKEKEGAILISPMEAKDKLGVGRNEIYNLCKREDFPCFKIGNKYYINADKMQDWADKMSMEKEVL
ncbi:helix-turn-helix domain-containing protein [Clostridium baratii]